MRRKTPRQNLEARRDRQQFKSEKTRKLQRDRQADADLCLPVFLHNSGDSGPYMKPETIARKEAARREMLERKAERRGK